MFTQGNQQIPFHRKVTVNVQQAASSLPTASSFYFQMSQVADFSDISNIAQLVKLMGVTLKWLPATNSETGTISWIQYAPNVNNISNTTPTADIMRSNNQTKSHDITKPFSFSMVPVYPTQLGNQVSTYYGLEPTNSRWIDPNSASLISYAFDWYVPDTLLTAGTVLGSWEITYHILAMGIH